MTTPPVVPTEAGTQDTQGAEALDSRLRGISPAVVPAQAGTQDRSG